MNLETFTVQIVTAYLSIGIMFILLLLVIVYHIFRYASAKVYAVCFCSNFCKMMKYHLEYYDQEQESSSRDNYNLLDFIDNPREMEEYAAPPLHLRHGPTVTTTTVSMTDSVKSESP